jgi:hypothetical protein
MPVAFMMGIAAIKSGWAALAMVAYYALLITSLWRCGRLPGGAGWLYRLAFVVTVIHAIAAQLFIGRSWFHWGFSENYLMPVLLLGILAVYVLTSWAAAALASVNSRKGEACFHFIAPGAIFALGSLPLISFGVYLVQGFRGACLAKASQSHFQPEDSEIGFSPSVGG